SLAGYHIDFGRDVGVTLAKLHEGGYHLGRPGFLHLRVGEGLEPIAAESLNRNASREKVCTQAFRIVDAPMTVVQVSGIERMLVLGGAQYQGGLKIQASSMGDGAADHAAGREPSRCMAKNLHRPLDMLKDVAEHDRIEQSGRREVLKERMHHRRIWEPLFQIA